MSIIKKNDWIKFDNQQREKAKCNGIYIYKKDKDYIYVGQSYGKTSSILKRINDHYKEITDKSKKRWYCFFSKKNNRSNLKIFWREMNDSLQRNALEAMLTYVLEPRFSKCTRECYKSNLKRKRKTCFLNRDVFGMEKKV